MRPQLNCLTRQGKLAEIVGFSEFCLSEGFAESLAGHAPTREIVRFLALLNRSPGEKSLVQSPVYEMFFAPVAKMPTRYPLLILRPGTLRAGPF
jgi:hypothetical protein